MNTCELCETHGGEIVWQDDLCRVVWNAHVAEMTDLPAADQRHLMNAVFATEAALRSLLRPDKIIIALHS